VIKKIEIKHHCNDLIVNQYQYTETNMRFAYNCSPVKTFKAIRSIPGERIVSLLEQHKNYPTLSGFDRLKKYSDDYYTFSERVKDQDTCILDLARSRPGAPEAPEAQEAPEAPGPTHINININENKASLFQDIFFDNFDQHLEPINGINPWNKERITIFVNLIYHLRQSLASSRGELFTVTDAIIEHWFPDDWIGRGKEYIPGDHFAKPFLDTWYDTGFGHINVFPIKQLIQDMCKYCLTDHSLVLYYQIKERNRLAGIADDCAGQVSESSESLNRDISLQGSVQKHGYKQICKLFPEYQFELVFEDQLSSMCLSAIHQAIQQIDALHGINNPDTSNPAKEWVIRDGKTNSDNDMLSTISGHPAVQECGHSGMSMSWTLSNIKSIYTDGWDHWIQLTLARRGIGITELSFDAGVDMGLENVCMYWFEKESRQGNHVSARYPDTVSLCRMINDKHFEKLAGMTLNIYGKYLTSEQYFNILWDLEKKYDWGLHNIYKKYWTLYYPEDAAVDCRAINKNDLILALWRKLPAEQDDVESRVLFLSSQELKVPTADEIDEALEKKSGIYRLGGKYFMFIGSQDSWNLVSTLRFDIAMREFGAFKSICSEITARSGDQTKQDPMDNTFCKL
jgi:hypothetical protein